MHGLSVLCRTEEYRRLRRYRLDCLSKETGLTVRAVICIDCKRKFVAPEKSRWIKCEDCQASKNIRTSALAGAGETETEKEEK